MVTLVYRAVTFKIMMWFSVFSFSCINLNNKLVGKGWYETGGVTRAGTRRGPRVTGTWFSAGTGTCDILGFREFRCEFPPTLGPTIILPNAC